MKLRIKAILSGLATYVPGYDFLNATGGTDSARYCYSVWLRHLKLLHEARALRGVPQTVAELGPGDSIGIGLAALLSGAERYYALDVVPYPDLKSNLAIFDELVRLFRERAPIPADAEFPGMQPELADYTFPHEILSDAGLTAALVPERVADIRESLSRVNEPGSRIVYFAPWNDPSVIQGHSIDLIYSQAVLEHVTDMSGVYEAMHRWLKPDGVMSHQIDYRCHGKADTWNGHWTYSDPVWKIVVGRRPYLLNRAPHSEHMRLLRAAGFAVVNERPVQAPSELKPSQLASRFRAMPERDLTTCGAYVVAAAQGSAH